MPLDEVPLNPDEPLAPVEIAPLERSELAEPEPGSEGTEEKRIPLRELPTQAAGTERGIGRKVAVLYRL